MGNVGGEVKVITIPLIFAFSLLKRNDGGGGGEEEKNTAIVFIIVLSGVLSVPANQR